MHSISEFATRGLVALDALDKARARRDDLWKLITLRYVEGGQIPSDKARDYSFRA